MTMAEEKGMKPIWYFVGLLMLVVGALIMAAGIYYLFYPSQSSTVLYHLHPNLWWGGIMVIFGIVLVWLNKGVTVE